MCFLTLFALVKRKESCRMYGKTFCLLWFFSLFLSFSSFFVWFYVCRISHISPFSNYLLIICWQFWLLLLSSPGCVMLMWLCVFCALPKCSTTVSTYVYVLIKWLILCNDCVSHRRFDKYLFYLVFFSSTVFAIFFRSFLCERLYFYVCKILSKRERRTVTWAIF